MILFDNEHRQMTVTNGGYWNGGLPIRDTYVQYGGPHGVGGVLYEPVLPTENSRIAVLMIHAEMDYSTLNLGPELAKRGFRAFGSRVSDGNGELDRKLADVRNAVEFLRTYPGVEKVVLMGHSGGATVMSAYQRIAENGVAGVQGGDMLYRCRLERELIPADACLFLDSNYGNGAMSLMSIDPAVISDDCGTVLDPELDTFSPASGFDPKGAHYTEAFKAKFFAAQAARNNRIIDELRARLELVERGEGKFLDDEPVCLAGASQLGLFNKLVNYDMGLLAHTRRPHDILHPDGTITRDIPESVRLPLPFHVTSAQMSSCVRCSLRAYLSEHAVYAGEDYAICEDGVRGILWGNTYSCTPGNAPYIHVPVLIMGMTGSYEYGAAEEIYDASPAADKTIAFVEGAEHLFSPNHEAETYPGQYGDTEMILYNYVADWLGGHRF